MPAASLRRDSEPAPAPLVVSPRAACRMLDCSHGHLYQLIAAGAVESFRSGRARKITIASINRYIARGIAEERQRGQIATAEGAAV